MAPEERAKIKIHLNRKNQILPDKITTKPFWEVN